MWFMVLNAVLAGASAVFAFIALLKSQPETRLYAAMYASRAIPLGVATTIAVLFSSGSAAVALLGVAACAQFGDAFIGLWRRELGMIVVPAIGGACHLLAAVLV